MALDCILQVQGKSDVSNPPLQKIMAAISSMDTSKNRSANNNYMLARGFCVLIRSKNNFVQTAGSEGLCAVEWREVDEAYYTGYQHWIAGRPGRANEEVTIAVTDGGQLTVKSNERLSVQDAKIIFEAFVLGKNRPSNYEWRSKMAFFGDGMFVDSAHRPYRL